MRSPNFGILSIATCYFGTLAVLANLVPFITLIPLAVMAVLAPLATFTPYWYPLKTWLLLSIRYRVSQKEVCDLVVFQ